MHCSDVRLHLGSITHDQFKSRVSLDPHYFFLTHPELLSKCNFVEFNLNNSEIVAQLWGARTNKLNINYEKLSIALRHYYDRVMICKVYGKWFVYKFVCDLKQLLGYSAMPASRVGWWRRLTGRVWLAFELSTDGRSCLAGLSTVRSKLCSEGKKF